jgi:hypothetical protein
MANEVLYTKIILDVFVGGTKQNVKGKGGQESFSTRQGAFQE